MVDYLAAAKVERRVDNLAANRLSGWLITLLRRRLRLFIELRVSGCVSPNTALRFFRQSLYNGSARSYLP